MDTEKALINRNHAAELFAQMVFDTGYKEGLVAPFDDMARFSSDEPLQKAAETFARLDDEQKDCFRFLLGKGVYAALFHILVNLDGDAVGYDKIDGRPAEFTLGLRVYEGISESGETGPVVQEVPIVPTEYGDNLHDLFAWLVDESTGIA